MYWLIIQYKFLLTICDVYKLLFVYSSTCIFIVSTLFKSAALDDPSMLIQSTFCNILFDIVYVYLFR